MNLIAFIHAKGHSQRVPNKNLKLLGGEPLFTYAIKNALRASSISRVIIDSDSDEILDIGQALGAEPLKRPDELSTNLATGDDLAYWQASNYQDSDGVVQVVPTAPFIQPESIDKAAHILREGSFDSVVGVAEERFYFWKDGKPSYFDAEGRIPNSFQLKPSVYETTGLYMNRTSYVLESKRRMNPNNLAPIQLSKLESIDINTPEDFEFAEIILNGLKHLAGGSS